MSLSARWKCGPRVQKLSTTTAEHKAKHGVLVRAEPRGNAQSQPCFQLSDSALCWWRDRIWNLQTLCCHPPLQIEKVCSISPNNKGKGSLLMTLFDPLFSPTTKETKMQARAALSWGKCSAQLLGICSACFLKLGHMLLWMVGFKWEGTDAVSSGMLIISSQNAIKTHKLLKQFTWNCQQVLENKETTILGVLSMVRGHPRNRKWELRKWIWSAHLLLLSKETMTKKQWQMKWGLGEQHKLGQEE